MNKKNNKPLFIVFEGSDGCGKSTISEMVAKKLNAEWVTTPNKCIADERKKIDTLYENSDLASQLFYASAVVHASVLAKRLLDKKISLVMDRYWASTIVYDTIVRNSEIEDNVWMNVIFNNIFVPDFTVYLSANSKTREERMNTRGEHNSTDKESVEKTKPLENRYKKLLCQFSSKAGKVLFIKNEKTQEECLTEIMNKIQKSH